MRESEEKFRQLADNITDGFRITSPDLQRVHYVSPAYELDLGSLDREPGYAPTGMSGWKLILPEERDRVFGALHSDGHGRPEVSVEYRISRPDGTVRWVLNRGFQVRDAAGDLVRLTGIACDITERKQIEEAQQRQQTELRVLFDLIPAMILFKDTENRILRVNQRLRKPPGSLWKRSKENPICEIHPRKRLNFMRMIWK